MIVQRGGRNRLSGRQRAAVLLVALGADAAAKVYKFLSDGDMEQISLEIARKGTVHPDERDRVMEEFLGMAIARKYVTHGGLDYARAILERAMGSQRATEIIDRLVQSMQVPPFDFVRKSDPAQIATFLQNEHPQTIALILAYLPPEKTAIVLSALPADRQADVARRIAIMDRTSPDIIKEIEQVLEQQFSSVLRDDFTSAGGVEAVVEIINRVDRATEKTIMEALVVQDPTLAEEIKKRMFVFEDLIQLDDRTIQRVLREVDMSRDLPLALKVGSDEVKRKITANVSKRAADTLKEAMDFLGPVRLRDVEEAQAKIVNAVRRLEEEGQIAIARGGGDEIVD